jgi:hypothetical protein
VPIFTVAIAILRVDLDYRNVLPFPFCALFAFLGQLRRLRMPRAVSGDSAASSPPLAHSSVIMRYRESDTLHLRLCKSYHQIARPNRCIRKINLLTVIIIEDIRTLQKSGLASLAFFYCDFRDDQKKDFHGLLPSLLVQPGDQSDACSTILSDFYVTHRRGLQHASDGKLRECLKDMLKLPGQAPVHYYRCRGRMSHNNVFAIVSMVS